jgi:DNA-binding transcriptional MerR regulator
MAIDELARSTGSTTRNIRALQSAGLLLPPRILGRTAHYGPPHLERLEAVLRLQRCGFSIASIKALLEALSAGRSLEDVLGLPSSAHTSVPTSAQRDEDQGTIERPPGPVRALRLLSILPSTMLDEAL